MPFDGTKTKHPSMIDVLMEVSAFYNIDGGAIQGGIRTKETVEARHMAMFVMHKLCRAPFVRVAEFFGRDHTTVLYAVKRIGDLVEQNTEHKRNYESLCEILDNNKSADVRSIALKISVRQYEKRMTEALNKLTPDQILTALERAVDSKTE